MNKKKVKGLSHLVDLELLNNLSDSASSVYIALFDGRRTGRMHSPCAPSAQIETELAAIDAMLNTDQVDRELKPSYVYKQFFLAHKLGQYSKALNYIIEAMFWLNLVKHMQQYHLMIEHWN